MSDNDKTSVEELRAEEEQAQADFDAGAEEEKPSKGKAEPKAAAKSEAKPDPKAEPKDEKPDKPKAEPEEPPPPEYVQITKEQFARLENTANRTAELEQQIRKYFGMFGPVQKAINELQAGTPRGLKVEIPKDAFDGMARDFPELAEHTRAALEATLRGITGTGPVNAEIDPEHLRQLVGEHAAKLRVDAEIEALDDTFPDWRVIVGQVDASTQAPDPNNPFRKWLAGKDAAYQAKLNSTTSAAVISRAIQLFQQEMKPAPKPTQQNLQQLQRQARIADAVKPRGDGGQAPATNENDDFAAGFASG